MPDDQSNIPTRPVPPPSPAAEGITPVLAAAMLGAARPAGGPWQPPSPEELQRDFPLYEIRGILGRGGMGAVYKGWQNSLDRLVAIKILPPDLEDGISGFTERFKREAKSMAQLEHPGIVAVYDAGTTPSGLLYFVMQCITGTDVQKLVTERGRLEPAEALRITSAVCDALGYAHVHGVIHRDIKPSNIMLDAHGAVKVADFGLAKSTAPETTMLTGSNISMGTPDFMAPESHFGAAQVDHRADLYAVGVMLYQMLTGRLPKGRFDPPSRAVPGLDKRLDAIVDKALQTDPASRYSSAIELRTAIEPVLARLGGTRRSARVSSESGAQRSARGATRSTLAVVTVLAVLGIVAFFVFGKKEPQLREREPSAKPEQSSPALQRVEPSATDGRPDGLKPSTTLPAALSPSTEPWIDALADKSQLYIRDAEITPQGLRFPGTGLASFKNGPKRDGAVRMLATYDPAKADLYLRARSRALSGSSEKPQSDLYRVAIQGSGSKAVLGYTQSVGTKMRILREFPLPTPLRPGQDYELELRTVGSKLIVKFNGKLLGEAEDPTIAEGQFGIASTDAVPALVKALEYLDLGSAPVSPSPSLQVSKSSAALSPSTEPWVNGLADESRLFFSIKDIKVTPQGLQMPGSGTVKFLRGAAPGFYRDGAVRMLATYIPSKQGPFLYARTTDKSGALYKFGIILSNKAGLVLWDNVERKSRPIREFPLPRPLKPGEDYELELRVVGSNFTAKFNGRIIGEATESSVTEGQFGIATTGDTPVLVKALEYLNLDSGASSPSPTPQVSPSPPFPPGQWTKVFTKAEDIETNVLGKTSFTWCEGWIDGTAVVQGSGRSILILPGSKGRNQGMRLHGKFQLPRPALFGCTISVRRSRDPAGPRRYTSSIQSDGNVQIGYSIETQTTQERLGVTRIGPAFAPDAEFDLELIVIGDKLYSRCNGKPLPIVTDTRLTEGELAVQTNHLIRDVEVINLDGLSEAEARKAAGVEGK